MHYASCTKKDVIAWLKKQSAYGTNAQASSTWKDVIASLKKQSVYKTNTIKRKMFLLASQKKYFHISYCFCEGSAFWPVCRIPIIPY